MKFRSGILGLVVVISAVMVTALAGIFMNTTTTYTTATEYEPVTDITGLWATTQEPEYLDYDPIQNWTGYHLAGETAVSGIDYSTLQQGSNIYAINSETWSGTQSMDARTVWNHPFPMSGVNWQAVVATQPYDDATDRATDQYGEYATITGWWGPGGEHATSCVQPLSRIMTGMSYGDSTHIVIDATAGGVLFSLWSQWSYSSTYLMVVEDPPIRENFYWIDLGAMSAVATLDINPTTNAVIAYDRDGTLLWTGTTSSVVAFVSAGYIDDGIPEYYYSDSNPDRQDYYTIIYSYTLGMSTTYMDISQGVATATMGVGVTWENGHRNSRIDLVIHASETGVGRLTVLTGFQGSGYAAQFNLTMDTRVGIRDITITNPLTNSVSITGYTHALIRFDAAANLVTVVPIIDWASFTDYRPLDLSLGKTLALSYVDTGLPISFMAFTTPTSSAYSIRFGITSTTVFMNTYDTVIKDATLDYYNYFQYDKARIMFRSFALYGDSWTVASHTYPVTDGYIEIGGENHRLANVGLEYDMTNRTVAFVTDKGKTIPLGGSGPLTVNGTWAFTTDIYEGVQVEKRDVSVDLFGWAFGDETTAIAFYLGMLVLGTVLATRIQTVTFTDLVVVAVAGIFGYVLMG